MKCNKYSTGIEDDDDDDDKNNKETTHTEQSMRAKCENAHNNQSCACCYGGAFIYLYIYEFI